MEGLNGWSEILRAVGAMTGKKKLGLIVNPIAGIGGRVGLKGSDGAETIQMAKELGAVPTSPGRAMDALRRLRPMRDQLELITPSGDMGEDEAKECGFEPAVLSFATARDCTTAEDTRRAAAEMARMGVQLILFAGGDGTARDVYEAVRDTVPVLGIPAGVKIHSGVYAISPRSAGDLAAMFLQNDRVAVREAEVMDIDEAAFREDRVSASLYGYLKVPYEQTMVQSAKSGSPVAEEVFSEAIAAYIVDNMEDDVLYIIGPGTTTRPIFDRLGLHKTLLGVDAVVDGKIVASDANEAVLLRLLDGRRAKIIVTVIGGQGFIFGRGSQQISPAVIRSVGKENVVVVAAPTKLAALGGKPLLVDTGDEELDRAFEGYMKVVTGYGRRAAYKVKSG